MHIYIHVPFCASKCPYCAFGSHSGRSGDIALYFDALMREILAFLEDFSGQISTIFIGGGTPSVAPARFYEPLFSAFAPFLGKDAEITVEANPNSADLPWLSEMRNLGVNRVSFGAQSFNADKLRFLGRAHGVRDIFVAVENARKAGIDNINLDLIYGTKFDTKKFILGEISAILSLDINHISAYSLTLENGTPWENKISYQKDSVRVSEFLFSELFNGGFCQYEISNFAKFKDEFKSEISDFKEKFIPNLEDKIWACRHNLGYWRGEIYAGFGAYSVSFDGHSRNTSPNLDEYLKNPFAKNREKLSAENITLERIFLGARSIIGINKNELNSAQISNANLLYKNQILKKFQNRFYNKNFLLSDEIALQIDS